MIFMEFKTIKGQHFINSKLVDIDTYTSMLEDYCLKLEEKSLINSDNITVKNPQPINNCEKDCSCESEYCSEGDNLLDIIYTLEELDDDESVEFLRNIINEETKKSFICGAKSVYDSLGTDFLKIAARLENEIEDMEDDECIG